MSAEAVNQNTKDKDVTVSAMEDPSPFMVITAPLTGVPIREEPIADHRDYRG